jgi:hypothetical protein
LREIWLDRLDDQSRLVGRLDASERRLSPAGEIEDVFDATRPSVRAGWGRCELHVNYASARHGLGGAEQWPWADRSISNR